jgi:lipoprotein
MTHEEKKTFLDNIVKLIIGIILLTSCFFYLHQNSAEKIAIYSGFRTIAQKVEVFFYKIIGKNGQLLEQRYKLGEKFSELISVAEEK